MKKLLFLWCIFPYCKSHSQSLNSNFFDKNDPLLLEVVCFNETTSIRSNIKFILGLTNQSNDSVFVASNIIATNTNNKVGNFIYEIYYYGIDTLNVALLHDEDINFPYWSLKSTFSLIPMGRKLYEIIFPGYYFEKRGLYKFRFRFKAKEYNKEMNEIYSDWVSVIIE